MTVNFARKHHSALCFQQKIEMRRVEVKSKFIGALRVANGSRNKDPLPPAFANRREDVSDLPRTPLVSKTIASANVTTDSPIRRAFAQNL